MQLPPKSTAAGRILRVSRRTLARLKANPKAKALLPKFKPAHDALKAAQLAYNDADDVAIDASALVEECDYNAREALTDFQLDLVAFVRRDYTAALYVHFFKDGLGAAKDGQGQVLQATLTAVIGHLATLPVDHKLQVHAKPLQAALAAYAEPLAAETKALAARDAAWTALDVARNQWLTAYDALAGSLRALFPGRKAFVDGFFARWTGGKGKVN